MPVAEAGLTPSSSAIADVVAGPSLSELPDRFEVVLCRFTEHDVILI